MALPPLDPKNVSALDQYRTMTPEQVAAYTEYLKTNPNGWGTNLLGDSAGSGLSASYQPFSDATANVPNANPTAGYGGYQLSGGPLTQSGATPFFADLAGLNQAYGTSFTPGQVPTAETVGSRARGDANTASNFDNLMQNTAIAALAYGGGSALGSLGAAGEAVPAGTGTGAGVGAGTAGGLEAATSAGTAATGVAPAATQGLVGELGAAGAAGTAASGLGGSGASGATGTALSRILDGTYNTSDLLGVGGNIGSTLLGVAGSRNQQNALTQLAQQQMAMGAPYRDKLAAIYNDPNAFLKSSEVQTPVQQGTDALARSLSVQGNPMGSGTALQGLQDYSANQLFGRLGEEKNRLAGFGGLTSFNAAAPGTSTAAVNAGSNVYNAVGSGIASLTNPNPSLVDIFKAMKGLA